MKDSAFLPDRLAGTAWTFFTTMRMAMTGGLIRKI